MKHTALAHIIGHDQHSINLDNAASTPALKQVLQAVQDFLPLYASVHRGAGRKSQISTDAYEAVRQTVTQFVGADPREHTVIFGKNTTEAINKAASRIGLRKTDVVVTSLAEHHSNELPWRTRATVRRIAVLPDGSFDMQHFAHLLARYKGRIKLVAITGASNVTGYMPDIYTIARMAHAAGAQILVDAAQLVAHRQLHMGTLHDPSHLDYVAFSAHKMYAPFGTGVLVGRRDTFATGAPEYTGGGTVQLVTARSIDWADTPERDEAGSPNVVGVVALGAAITALQRIGMEHIAAHEAELTEYALAQLHALPHITLYGPTKNRGAVMTFSVKNMHHTTVARRLNDTFGIATRSGCFCAHMYVFELLGVTAKRQQALRANIGNPAAMPGMVRASFGLYNTHKDIDALIAALKTFA